jgi:pimeloyl-ACP methyl ester carboxylesterase
VSEAEVALPCGLRGTLTAPGAARDAVLIVPGSGPVDRDGNAVAIGLHTDCYRLLAEDLAGLGLAVLRIDKRGVGRSGDVREQDLRLQTFADDLISWVDFLAGQGMRVFLLGHSEGALIASMAARRRAVAGLILAGGAGQPLAPVLRRQLRDAGLDMALLARAEECLSMLAAKRMVADPPPELAGLFRPSVQPYLISWLGADPVAELAGLTVPALVVRGDRDLQTSVEDAAALAACRSGVNLRVVAGMNHVFKSAPADRSGNLATYGDPALPLVPELCRVLAEFLVNQGVALKGALR